MELLALRKAELKRQMDAKKQHIAQLGKTLAAPLAPATKKAGGLMSAFNTGMAVFDGVMMGIKFMRKIKRAFR